MAGALGGWRGRPAPPPPPPPRHTCATDAPPAHHAYTPAPLVISKGGGKGRPHVSPPLPWW